MFKYLVFNILILLPILAFSQQETPISDANNKYGFIERDSALPATIIIQTIELEGNKKTKERIILRELGLKAGDTISTADIDYRLLWVKNRIFNTALFLKVDLNLTGPDSVLKTLYITVKERFYSYPIPYGDLADRNFNEWWQDRNHDLSRIDVGIDYRQKNIRGRNETLKLKAITGFNNKIEFSYNIPYIDKKLKTGLTIITNFLTSRQVAYETLENKLVYFENNSVAREKLTSGFILSRRNNFYVTHQLGLTYNYNFIADTVAKLNPDFFLNGKDAQQYLSLKYTYTNDHRDYVYYPLKGTLLKVETEALGLGISKDITFYNLRVESAYFLPLSKKFFFAVGLRAKTSYPRVQPYANERGLGYNQEWVSGYERYVINGQHYGLLKTNLKLKLFSKEFQTKILPNSKFRTIPLIIYLKMHNDFGYVVDNTYDPNNYRLVNTLLWGGGLGLDMITYYDIVFRVEYSVNRDLQRGFFFNLKAPI